MKKKEISRSDARMRAVWKGPMSSLDRSQRMAVKTLQRHGFEVTISDDGKGFDTAALDSELPEEATHALETLKHVCNIRARLPRLVASMDDSARSQLWLLMFDCIGLGRHSHSRLVIRRKTRRLPDGRRQAAKENRKRGMDTKTRVRDKWNRHKLLRTPEAEIARKIAADLDMSVGHVKNLIRDLNLK